MRIAMVGGRYDHEANRVFTAFRQLFFAPIRISALSKWLPEIPYDSEQLLKIAKCVEGVAQYEDLPASKYNINAVVRTILAITDPDAYLRAYLQNYYDPETTAWVTASCFHPNTRAKLMENLALRRRGLCGYGRDMSGHRKQVHEAMERKTIRAGGVR